MTDSSSTIIESLGVYLPPRSVATSEIVSRCRNEIKFPLEQLTGIRARPMAGDGEYAFDIACKAVTDCLANSRHTAESIDLLICCNISRCDGPDTRFSFEPSTSIRLRRKFGFANALAFDISNACAGMFTAIAVVNAYLRQGLARRAMIVSGEYITHLTLTAQKEIDSFLDQRLACLTLGDAGAALILEQTDRPDVGFRLIDLYTRGEYSTCCIAKASDRPHGGAIMYTDSVRLSAIGIRHAVSHALESLKRGGWKPSEIDHLVMHQVSRMTLSDAAKEINRVLGAEVCHDGNVVYNLAERGNTATTSHFVALMDLIRKGRLRQGDKVLLSVTGSGLTMGTALYTVDDLPDRVSRKARSEDAAAKPSDVNGLPKVEAVPRVRIASVGKVRPEAGVACETLALATAAAEDCLARSGLQRSDVELLLFAGVYRNDFLLEPAIAALLAGNLKLGPTGDQQATSEFHAFDVFNGGLGLLNACHIATQLLESSDQKIALITTSEIENNREARPEMLLGLEETGSALLLVRDDHAGIGFGAFGFASFDEHVDELIVHTSRLNGKHCLEVTRDPAYEAALRKAVMDAIHAFLKAQGKTLAEVDVFLFPQHSRKFVQDLIEELGIPSDRCVNIAHDVTDLFTSSLPLAFEAARERGLAQSGKLGLIVGSGSGIQVGCAFYHF